MIVAVTGASGFLGSCVARRLRERGHSVHAYGRRDRAAVPADLRDMYASWDIASGTLDSAPAVDAVVHCAGTVTDWGPRKLFETVNVDGTRSVARTWPAARFVHISTASAYDPTHGADVITEDLIDPTDRAAIDDIRWLNDYGRTKRLAEHVVATEVRDWIILRPHAIYGPGDTQLAPKLVSRIRRGRLLIPGTGQVRVSVVHIDNLLDAIERSLDTDVRGAYNIADGVVPSVDETMNALLDSMGRDARIVHVPRWLAWSLGWLLEKIWRVAGATDAPPVSRYVVAHLAWDNVVDISRARRDLGYVPTIGYPESFATISIGGE